MFTESYCKRKNTELFNKLQLSSLLNLSKIQNFNPLYNTLYKLSENNYNAINLPHNHYISNVYSLPIDDELYNPLTSIFMGKINNINNSDCKKKASTTKHVFFKIAPLLEPLKYLIGKYDITSNKLISLPKFNSTTQDCMPEILDTNNTAYIDSFFAFLSSKLLFEHNFVNGINFYGSFLAVQNNFKVNIFDDIEYLYMSDFFNSNKNKLFKIDNDYDDITLYSNNKPLINIGENVKISSFKSLNDDIFENIFDDSNKSMPVISQELVDITNNKQINDECISLKSSSSCSSRSSYTNCGLDEQYDDDEFIENDDISVVDSNIENYCNQPISETSSELSECILNAEIPQMPVQIIATECCIETLDQLLCENTLSNEEWFALLMQIIMTLITYQKVFNFTHNDLHTNNIMYTLTSEKYLVYCYKNTYYRVPTFGKIFKIIDFGRSIYKYNKNIYCSSDFKKGGEADTQYNTEPYFNNAKHRIDPNMSFDLCRLACSISEYIFDDFTETVIIDKINDPLKRIITEWCIDDKGKHIIYKSNGDERYPDFKLYKMIARCVHNHTPVAQLSRKEFSAFMIHKSDIHDKTKIINIDLIPSYL